MGSVFEFIATSDADFSVADIARIVGLLLFLAFSIALFFLSPQRREALSAVLCLIGLVVSFVIYDFVCQALDIHPIHTRSFHVSTRSAR